MDYTGRVINASFNDENYPADITLIIFTELEDGQLIRLEDTGPRSYLCKRYHVRTDETGKDDFRDLTGREIEIGQMGNEYRFIKFV